MELRKGLLIVMLLSAAIAGCKKEPATPPEPNGAGPDANGTAVSQGTIIDVNDADLFPDANEQMPTKIGDKAWDLRTLDCLKGGPWIIEPGTVFVVEFWATSSEPSVAAIGPLTELAQKYKDKRVVVVGISKEALGVVRAFVDERVEKIGYDIGVDPDESVYDAYMTSFGQTDVPYAFIVDSSGNIAWHGSPTADMEQPLEKALSAMPEPPDVPEEDTLIEVPDVPVEEVLSETPNVPEEKVEE